MNLMSVLSSVPVQAGLFALLLWSLGIFAKSAAYQKSRAAAGRFSFLAGAALSKVGNSRLKGAWQPIENILVDFVGFQIEQLLAGLRDDNVKKMEDQVQRLDQVGSVTRSNALKEKLDLLRDAPAPGGESDAFVQAVEEQVKAAAEEKLKQ